MPVFYDVEFELVIKCLSGLYGDSLILKFSGVCKIVAINEYS